MSSSALHQVNNAAKCILFVDAVRLHLLENDALFWWNSIFGTVAEKAAAAPRMTRAARLETKIEAEYYALTEGTKEALNLRFLLRDLGFGQSRPTELFCDNKGAITMSLHPANKPATRHIDMRIHFCRQHVEAGDVTTTFAPTPAMVADFMTKQTLRLTHERHCRRVFGDQLAPLPLEPITRVVA